MALRAHQSITSPVLTKYRTFFPSSDSLQCIRERISMNEGVHASGQASMADSPLLVPFCAFVHQASSSAMMQHPANEGDSHPSLQSASPGPTLCSSNCSQHLPGLPVPHATSHLLTLRVQHHIGCVNGRFALLDLLRIISGSSPLVELGLHACMQG